MMIIRVISTIHSVKMVGFDFGKTATIDNNLSDQSIAGVNISQPILSLNFHNVSFQRCDLSGTTFTDCQFHNCEFHKMILGDVVFYKCNLSGSKFYHATWNSLVFIDCDLSGVELKDFDEPSSNPFYTSLVNCNTTGTQFINYDVSRIKLIGCYQNK